MGALASCLLCDRIAGALQAQDGGSPPPRGLPLRFCILSRDGKSAPAPALYRVWDAGALFWQDRRDVMGSDLFLVAGVVLCLLGFWFAGAICIGLAWLLFRAQR